MLLLKLSGFQAPAVHSTASQPSVQRRPSADSVGYESSHKTLRIELVLLGGGRAEQRVNGPFGYVECQCTLIIQREIQLSQREASAASSYYHSVVCVHYVPP